MQVRIAGPAFAYLSALIRTGVEVFPADIRFPFLWKDRGG